MTSLIERYRAVVCDLDGVVYRGHEALPGAVEALEGVRRRGTGVAYATNNASRTPQQVVEHLRSVGVWAEPAQVQTSAMAGARVLADALPAGADVLAVGGAGVPAALTAAGLTPFTPAQQAHRREGVEGVLQGYGATVSATDLAEAAYAVQQGARWVVTNSDRTLPTDRGIAPGNGTLVDAVRETVSMAPEVVGKPGPLMYQQAASALHVAAADTLAIGDRLETDLAGARAAGMDCLHVLTGVHDERDLLVADASLRPRYVGADLSTLWEDYVEPAPQHDGAWQAAGLRCRLETEGSVRVCFDGSMSAAAQEPMVRMRLALALLWEALDTGRVTADDALAALPVRQ